MRSEEAGLTLNSCAQRFGGRCEPNTRSWSITPLEDWRRESSTVAPLSLSSGRCGAALHSDN
jgi:hypothetical protein